MSWVKLDDKLTSHPKWEAVDIYARALWLHVTVWCGAHNTDGVIPENSLTRRAHEALVPPALTMLAVDQLITARLWKRRPKSKGGGWEINDWLDFQPSRDQVERKKADREARDEKAALHTWLHKSPMGRRVKSIIQRRDGMWCRYCGVECRTDGDRRSPARLTYDLIDPASTWDRTGAAISPDEIERISTLWVVACGYCNAVKQKRTPDEADMEVLPAPGARGIRSRSAAIQSGPDREPGPDLAGSDRGRANQDGTDLFDPSPVLSRNGTTHHDGGT